jgi:hypothetical protein
MVYSSGRKRIWKLGHLLPTFLWGHNEKIFPVGPAAFHANFGRRSWSDKPSVYSGRLSQSSLSSLAA